MTTCDRTGCANEATKRPVLVLSSKATFFVKNSPFKSEFFIGLKICDGCAADLKPSDLIADDGWAMIDTAFKAIHRVEPDRARTTVRFVPLDDPSATIFEKGRGH